MKKLFTTILAKRIKVKGCGYEDKKDYTITLKNSK